MFDGGSAATAATATSVAVQVAPTVDASAAVSGCTPGWGRSAALLVKSSFDVVCAALGLIVLAPILLIVAAVVRFSSAGPAFFRQTRVGRNGETFTMLKFRTMYSGAERRLAELLDHNDSEGGVLFKMHDDPRVTPAGRVLRRLSIDELPQLINVLTGKMSLVGPRPPLPREVSLYGARTRRRLLVKPGITGLWQVSGRSNLSWEDSVSLDLSYVENWSLALDTKVLLATARAVITADGAF
jgi:exopolysaccharide biosynthesis polyprenyl glycosylphosphotransferase